MRRQYSSPRRGCQLLRTAPVYGWPGRALALLFPPTCVLCLEPGQAPLLDLCAGCEADLPWIHAACPGCGLSRPDEAGPGIRCANCQQHPTVFDATFAPLAYAFPVDDLVRGLKYHRQLASGRVLGTLLGQRALDRGPGVEALVPVPLHRRREAARGYNQAAELARYAGRALGLPVVDDLVERCRPTAEQAGLDAEGRRRNLASAFRVRRQPGHGRIAILDDVMTTGSTVAELARVLKEAGAAHVEAWAVARALPHAAGTDQRKR